MNIGHKAPSLLAELTTKLVDDYRSDPRAQRINRHFLPSRKEIAEVIELLFSLFYPGFFGREDVSDTNVSYHVGMTLTELDEKLHRQIERCLCHGAELADLEHDVEVPPCRSHARAVTDAFLGRLPELRRQLIDDLQAAFDGDPAAKSLDEIVLAYPGLLAVTVHRVAHELYRLGVPMLPRIMAEWAHTKTGADIHPGANIGPRFFIDHATGVVVGETTEIGANVKLYQGVTLGALSFPKDEEGQLIRGTKRHPTVRDNVTIYANATVLGGRTVLEQGSVIGGSVFVTRSVPAGSRIALKPAEVTLSPLKPGEDPFVLDFEI
ncbi:MAG: serine O-acetyltransferase [Polyangiaceae bacterium]